MPVTPAKALAPGPGRGAAVQFGRESPNLFKLMDQAEARKAADAKLKNEQAKERGKQLIEDLKYNPEEVWSPWTDAIADRSQSHFDEIKESYKSGTSTDPETRAKWANDRNRIDSDINRINQFGAKTEEFYGEMAENPFYNTDNLHGFIGNIIHREDPETGKKELISTDELDPDLYEQFRDDPNNLNANEVTTAFVNNLPAQVISSLEKDGQTIDKKEIEFKLLQKEPDGEGGEILSVDADGNNIVKITPETIVEIKNSKEADMLVTQERERLAASEDRDVTYMEAAENVFAPKSYAKKKLVSKEDQRGMFLFKQRYLQGQKDEAVIGFMKPFAAVMQGSPEYFKQSTVEMVNGVPRTFKTARLPIGTGKAGEDVFYTFYQDEDNNISYSETDDFDSRRPATDDLAMRVVKNAGFTADQKAHAAKVFTRISDAGGNIDYTKIARPEGGFDVTRPKRFTGEDQAFTDAYTEESKAPNAEALTDRLNEACGRYSPTVVDNGNTYTNVRFELDEDKVTEKETRMVGEDADGKKVIIKEDIDHEKPEEVQDALKLLKKGRIGDISTGGAY